MEMPEPGQIVHVEIASKDPEATKKFFRAAFGWNLEKQDMGESPYWLRAGEAMPGVGLRDLMGPEHPGTVPFLYVPSVAESLGKVEKAGGKVMMGKQEIPGMGWFAVFSVPGGPVYGVWETDPKARATR